MRTIKTTQKPIWYGLLLTGGIVSIPYGILKATTEYYYDDKNLIIKEGVFVKRQKTIPLYRIIDIQASRNMLGYGTVTVSDKTGVKELRFIASPLEAAHALQLAKEQAQGKANIVHNELF